MADLSDRSVLIDDRLGQSPTRRNPPQFRGGKQQTFRIPLRRCTQNFACEDDLPMPGDAPGKHRIFLFLRVVKQDVEDDQRGTLLPQPVHQSRMDPTVPRFGKRLVQLLV